LPFVSLRPSSRPLDTRSGPRLRLAQPGRLLARVREVLIRLNYSVRTEEAYIHWIRRFIVHHA
jgi:hypothetical protein